MKNRIRDNKKVVITLIVSIIIILLMIGGSYAAFYYDFFGSTSNVDIQSVELKFLESDSNVINIENAMPMSDKQGIAQEKTYDFFVSSKTKKEIDITYNLKISKNGVVCDYVKNPTEENNLDCYDVKMNDSEKEKIINWMTDYFAFSSDDAILYYELQLNKNFDGLVKFYMNHNGITRSEAIDWVNYDKSCNYIFCVIDSYEYDTGEQINKEYEFNGNYVDYSNFLDDSQIKIYLTDYNDNKILGPIKISDLNEYIFYSGLHSHNQNHQLFVKKFKMRVWVDSEVDVSSWDDSTSYKYSFILNVNDVYSSEKMKSVKLDESGANAPVLTKNMLPVYYDNEEKVWKIADYQKNSEEHQWYDYDNKIWANSVTVVDDKRQEYKSSQPGTVVDMDDILTMQVWVPRFKYKVWNYNLDGTVTSEPQEIEIEFENGTSSTGEIECSDTFFGTSDGTLNGTESVVSEICKLKTGNVVCTDEGCNGKTYTHPAFTFGEEELPGFWVGKFELSGSSDFLTTKPNLHSYMSYKIANLNAYLKDFNRGGNIYGFYDIDDVHVIKNMEWGAVSYLSHSKYGINKRVEINGTSPAITGCGPVEEGSYSSGSICNSYDTTLGNMASTTGNIYGIYDMSGGFYDYVMGNMSSYDGDNMMSGYDSMWNSNFSGIIYDKKTFKYNVGMFAYPDDKYVDKYSFSLNESSLFSRGKLGDASKEVLASSNGWYNDSLRFVTPIAGAWIKRGGYSYQKTNQTGIFQLDSDDGAGSQAFNVISSRFIIS